MLRSAIIIEGLGGVNDIVLNLESSIESGISNSPDEIQKRKEKYGVNYIEIKE